MDTVNQIIQSKEFSTLMSFIMIASGGYLVQFELRKKLAAHRDRKAATKKTGGEL